MCKQMQWTYQEYMDQPREFLDTLEMMSHVEAIVAKAEQMKHR